MEQRPSHKPFTLSPEGTMTLKVDSATGAVESTSLDPVNANIPNIKSVGIANLVDVEEQAINRLVNSVSHFVRFYGGGEVHFAFNFEGKLLECKGVGVTTQILDGERILFHRKL